jgi:hypothetical protein
MMDKLKDVAGTSNVERRILQAFMFDLLLLVLLVKPQDLGQSMPYSNYRLGDG